MCPFSGSRTSRPRLGRPEPDSPNRRFCQPVVALTHTFDLIADPSERTDIAASKPEIVASMKPALREFQKSCRNSDAGNDYYNPLVSG